MSGFGALVSNVESAIRRALLELDRRIGAVEGEFGDGSGSCVIDGGTPTDDGFCILDGGTP